MDVNGIQANCDHHPFYDEMAMARPWPEVFNGEKVQVEVSWWGSD